MHGIYEIDGEKFDCAYPGIDLTEAKPVFTDMKPFHDDFKTEDQSEELATYINLIEKEVGIPVGILAFGPERKQIHFKKSYFS